MLVDVLHLLWELGALDLLHRKLPERFTPRAGRVPALFRPLLLDLVGRRSLLQRLKPRIVVADGWLALLAVGVEAQVLGVSRCLLKHVVGMHELGPLSRLLLLGKSGDDVPLADHLSQIHALEARLAVDHLAVRVVTQPYLLG